MAGVEQTINGGNGWDAINYQNDKSFIPKQDNASCWSSLHCLVCSLKWENYQNDNFYHFDYEKINNFIV